MFTCKEKFKGGRKRESTGKRIIFSSGENV